MTDRPEIHPVRSVNIIGVPALGILRAKAIRPGDELTSVREAEDIDRWNAHPADSNHCPLCNQFFGPEAFRAHAQDCINTHAGRWERNIDEEPVYPGRRFDGEPIRYRPRLFGAEPKGER